MAMVKEISYEFHLFGLNASTGAITLKQRIAGSPTNDSTSPSTPSPRTSGPACC